MSGCKLYRWEIKTVMSLGGEHKENHRLDTNFDFVFHACKVGRFSFLIILLCQDLREQKDAITLEFVKIKALLDKFRKYLVGNDGNIEDFGF